MLRDWLRNLRCRLGPCEPSYVRQQPDPNIVAKLELVPERIDRMIERERNLVEEAYLTEIGVAGLEERQRRGQ